jgi:hypothetical protein
MAYPFRKISDGISHTPAGDHAIFNWVDTTKTRPPEISQAIEPSQAKPVKQPIASAQAPNS